jgi:hypothetical protein
MVYWWFTDDDIIGTPIETITERDAAAIEAQNAARQHGSDLGR